jgi:hypothetical protein
MYFNAHRFDRVQIHNVHSEIRRRPSKAPIIEYCNEKKFEEAQDDNIIIIQLCYYHTTVSYKEISSFFLYLSIVAARAQGYISDHKGFKTCTIYISYLFYYVNFRIESI